MARGLNRRLALAFGDVRDRKLMREASDMDCLVFGVLLAMTGVEAELAAALMEWSLAVAKRIEP